MFAFLEVALSALLLIALLKILNDDAETDFMSAFITSIMLTVMVGALFYVANKQFGPLGLFVGLLLMAPVCGGVIFLMHSMPIKRAMLIGLIWIVVLIVFDRGVYYLTS